MLYIITAVHNRYTITEKFVDILLNQTYKDIKLILVDDGSTDGTDKMVLTKMPNSQIIYGDGNLWWGGALHKAYLWVKKNLKDEKDAYIMFANDDTEFDNEYIERALKIITTKKKTLLTGYGVGKQSGNQVDGAIDFQYATSNFPFSNNQIGNCASTRNLFFRVSDFFEIGGFHPILLPHYASDYEWTIRAVLKKGYTVYCDTTLRYYSNEETTGDSDFRKLSIKQIFSKRAYGNPIYRIIFIVMSTPLKWLFPATVNQVRRYLKKMKK